MPRLVDAVDRRPAERWTELFEQLHPSDHGVLILLVESVEPGAKLVGVLDLPHRHQYN
jgi:hypothetical protein